MTMRQLVAEVMRAHGHTEEEIKERNAFASSMVPGLPVDVDMAPENVKAMREHLERLYRQCEADPEGHAEWINQKTAELTRNN
jgi:hypothetical protein